MDIQPQYIDLSKLFHRRLFRIPPYQRAYSWQEKQRKALFDDIRKSFRKSLLSKNGGNHFMATIVCLRKKENITIITDEYQVVDIVDGQQRMTTLILLLKAISKALDRSDATEKKVGQDIDEILIKPDETSLLLLQTNHDSSNYFANYLRCGNYPRSSSENTSADERLLDAMRECETFVTEWKNDGSGLANLVGHVKNRLTFIFHEIDDEALVYTVFEVLNSRGLAVSWFDRLKSKLMAVVFEAQLGNKNETIQEVHQLWSEIYRIIGPHLDLSAESLRFAATLRSHKTPKKILNEENAAPRKTLNEENAVTELSSQSGTSAEVIDTIEWIKKVTEETVRLDAKARIKAVTRIAHARLVAVAVNLRSDLTDDARRLILRRWENVTFRIFGIHEKDARTAVGGYVSLAWRIVREEPSADRIMDDLSQIGRDYPIGGKDLPIDEAVKKFSKPDHYKGREETLRYFFYRYEEYLAGNANQKLGNQQWDRIWEATTAKSIEHISPQSTTEAGHVHWLGNLLLLPPGLNSKLGNQRPTDKAEEYRKTGLLIACDVADNIKHSRRWGRREIENRGKKLIEWAAVEWAD